MAIGDIEGVKKVSEWIMKDGRSIIITDAGVDVAGVPNGTLFVNPITNYTEKSKQIMVKTAGSTTWSIIDPTNVFKIGSIVNSLLSNDAVRNNNIMDKSVSKIKLDDPLNEIINNSIYVENGVVKTISGAGLSDSKHINMDLYADISLLSSSKNRALNVAGTINADKDITTKEKISAAYMLCSGEISAAKNITTQESILVNKNLNVGGQIATNNINISALLNAESEVIVGKNKDGKNIGIIKVIGYGHVTNDFVVSENLSVGININAANDITAGRNITANNDFNVKGNSIFEKELVVEQVLKVEGQGLFNSELKAKDNITSVIGGVYASKDIVSSNGALNIQQGGASIFDTIKSINGNIETSKGDIIANNDLVCNQGNLLVKTGGAEITGNINCKGTITATRVYNAVYKDLAEGFKPGEKTEPGDILAINENYEVVKATIFDRKVIGVHSDCYATCYGATQKEIQEGKKIPVGLIGQVPVKIKGKAEIGDLITCIGNGIGTVCNDPEPGTIVGKVLENKDYDEIGLVICLINLM